jgi:hypothetical protein
MLWLKSNIDIFFSLSSIKFYEQRVESISTSKEPRNQILKAISTIEGLFLAKFATFFRLELG